MQIKNKYTLYVALRLPRCKKKLQLKSRHNQRVCRQTTTYKAVQSNCAWRTLIRNTHILLHYYLSVYLYILNNPLTLRHLQPYSPQLAAKEATFFSIKQKRQESRFEAGSWLFSTICFLKYFGKRLHN
jgi:hypothetical protein